MTTISRAVKEIAPSLKGSIDKAGHDISVKIGDVKKALTDVSGNPKFLEMSDKDLYWKIQLPLFNEGITVLGGFKTKSGENGIRMRMSYPGEVSPYEEFPEWDIPEIGLLISEHGLLNVSISDMEDALVRNQEIIEKAESIFEDQLTIFLKSGIDCKKLIKGIIDLSHNLDAQYEEYYPEENTIEFLWGG